uniref:Acylglycerol kinase C-terminal domain-containing protein n=1 Tax=Anopheles culicifacies TaxID=139723 RepID=A0A182MPD4_9DIPT
MAFVIRFAKAVRNNWKKSTVFASALAYGVSYSNEKYEIKQLMRYYCTEASRYGEVKIGLNQRPPKVLVLLNPAANRKSSEEDVNVMRIEVLPSAADESPPEKPVYAVGALQWGAFRDILALRDKYWYTASLRDYTAFLFNAFDGAHTWNCKAKISYTEPCSGCSNCYKDMDDQWAAAKKQEQQPRRWWSVFVPRAKTNPKTDYSKIINEKCSVRHELEVDPSELVIKTGNVAVEDKESENNEESTKLEVLVGEQVDSSFSFIGDSWGRVNNRKYFECPVKESISVRTVELMPERLKVEETDPEIYYSIDNEAYEVRPVRITLVPKAVEIFTF